jgi:hypothetical protein
MKKMLFLIITLTVLFCSGPAFADDYFYYEHHSDHDYHPYHQHHRYYNGGHLHCNVCGLYHHPNHHHFYHQGYSYDRPVYVEHGRSIEGEIVTETREIVE